MKVRDILLLSDDYVKFIRMASHMIEKNGGCGVVAYISNNSYMFGLVHRTMRQRILTQFDKVYIINLHGNSNTGEIAPDGSTDENVFDIRQGVGIIILVRTKSDQKGLCPEVRYEDVWGSRKVKNDWLGSRSIIGLSKRLSPVADRYYFTPHDSAGFKEYQRSFSIDKFFPIASIGTKFRKDKLLVKPHFSPSSAVEMVCDVAKFDTPRLLNKYGFSETKDWQHEEKRHLFREGDTSSIAPVLYRQFDRRFTYYPPDRINQIITRGNSQNRFDEAYDRRPEFWACYRQAN